MSRFMSNPVTDKLTVYYYIRILLTDFSDFTIMKSMMLVGSLPIVIGTLQEKNALTPSSKPL